MADALEQRPTVLSCGCGNQTFRIDARTAFPACLACGRPFGVPDFSQEEWDDLWCIAHQAALDLQELLAEETSPVGREAVMTRIEIRKNLLDRIGRFALPSAQPGVATQRWKTGRKTTRNRERVVTFGSVIVAGPIMPERSQQHDEGDGEEFPENDPKSFSKSKRTGEEDPQ